VEKEMEYKRNKGKLWLNHDASSEAAAVGQKASLEKKQR